jgi:hypothetical protein
MSWRKPRPLRVLAIASVALGLARAAQLWSRRAPAVHEEHVERAASYWEREGFVAIESPVRPPTSRDGSARIVVYLRLPEGGRLTTAPGSGGQPLVVFPAGTTADRVEYFGARDDDAPPSPAWQVADVRGTTLAASGERFHVLRPEAGGAGSLLGLSWPRGDAAAQQAATLRLGELVASARVDPAVEPRGRQSAAEHLKGLNDCAGCHTHGRPPRSTPGLVNRGTDGSGFFHVSTALSNRAPLETYRPRNPNLRDRHVRFECEGGRPAEPDASVPGGVRCSDGGVPTGVLDIRAALRDGSLHAQRVCASRRLLFERLDSADQAAFREAMADCDAR